MKHSLLLVHIIAVPLLFVLSLPAHSWTRALTFENGALGAKAQSDSGSDFDGAAGGAYITDERVLRGEKAAKLTVTGGTTAYGEWGGIISFPELLRQGDEVWFSVNTFFPEGFNYDASGGGRLKFLRIHVQKTDGSNSGYNDWYLSREAVEIPHQFIYEGQQQWFTFGAISDEVQRGKWETYEMYVKFHPIPAAQGGSALVRVWKNGRLLREITEAETLNSSTDTSDRAHLFTYWNGSAPKTQHMYVDDIVITSETPPNRDAQGNPMIGGAGLEGQSSSGSRPAAPDLIVE